MKNKWIYIIFLLLITVSCQHNTKKTSDIPILSEKEMIDVLTDAYIAESSISLLKEKGYDTRKQTPKIYAHILDKHHTTKAVFDRSYKYYSDDFDKMKQIIEKVIINLNKIERNLSVKDSINKEGK